jgi:hypothetical protein
MEKLPNIRKIGVLKAIPALYTRRGRLGRRHPGAGSIARSLSTGVIFVNGMQVDEVLAAAFDLLESTERFGRQGKP